MSWRRRSCSTGLLRGRRLNHPVPWAAWSAAMSSSSARTCSAPVPSRSAAPMCAWPSCRRRRRSAASWRPRPATMPRAWLSRPSAWASRPGSTCRWASPCPSSRPPAATAPRWSCTATTSTRPSPRPKRYADETGAVFVHPFDNADIIAGQGTIGLEILEQVPNVDTILMGVGGGGLLAGVAVAVKARAKELGREIRVIGVQAENAAAYPPSLAADALVPLKKRLHHGRRHRRGPARASCRFRSSGNSSTTSSPSARTRWPGP